MGRKAKINYDEKELQAQLHEIRGSQVGAWSALVRGAFVKTKRLTTSDIPEAWGLALGDKTLRECTQSLISRIPDEVAFEDAILRLFETFKHGPMTATDFESANDPTDLLLVRSWTYLQAKDLSNPNETNPTMAKLLFHEDEESLEITSEFLHGSLCLYSDIAMAKAVFYVISGSLPRYDQLQKQTIALRSRYTRLGLIPSRPRLFKDFSPSRACPLVFFQKRLPGK